MKNLKLTSLLILLALAIAVASCKKEELPEMYMRGGNSLIQSFDNQIVIAGYNSSASNSYEATLVKTDLNGEVLWSNTYGTNNSDGFFKVINGHNSGILACGFSFATSSGSPNMMAVLTDSEGTKQWMKTYASGSYSQAFSAVKQADSGYILAGYIQKTTSSDRDIYVVAINNSGQEIWSRQYGAKLESQQDTLNDEAYGIAAAPDGGYYITGSINGYRNCCGKAFLMKIAVNGDSLWTKIFKYGVGYSVVSTPDGGAAIGGTLQETNNNDLMIIRTDQQGNNAISKIYSESGYEFGSSLINTSDGGLALTGITNTRGAGNQDVLLIKVKPNLDLDFPMRTYGESGLDQGFGLIQLADGGFCMTGLTNSGGSFIFLNRTSLDGTQQWIKKIR